MGFGWPVLGELFLGELSPFELRDYQCRQSIISIVTIPPPFFSEMNDAPCCNQWLAVGATATHSSCLSLTLGIFWSIDNQCKVAVAIKMCSNDGTYLAILSFFDGKLPSKCRGLARTQARTHVAWSFHREQIHMTDNISRYGRLTGWLLSKTFFPQRQNCR